MKDYQQLPEEDQATIRDNGILLSHSIDEILELNKRTSGIVEIGKSLIAGNGYIANRDIKEGELVIVTFGVVIGHQTEFHSIQQSLEVHIEPFEYGGKYLNHSCDGNLVVHSDKRGLANYHAKRNIARGGELNYPFALTEFEWSPDASENDIRCNCKSKNCSGVIKSFSMLSPEEQREFVESGIVSQYLVDWYNNQHQNIDK